MSGGDCPAVFVGEGGLVEFKGIHKTEGLRQFLELRRTFVDTGL